VQGDGPSIVGLGVLGPQPHPTIIVHTNGIVDVVFLVWSLYFLLLWIVGMFSVIKFKADRFLSS
jgi:hypothetical protein